jgi:hypothetical protein
VSVRASGGQASVELVGGIVVALLAGLIGFQLLAVGYAAVMADHAAEAAALALVNGQDPERAAGSALPGWPAGALEVRRPAQEQLRVRLTVPSPLGFLRHRLSVTGESAVKPPRDPPPGGSWER